MSGNNNNNGGNAGGTIMRSDQTLRLIQLYHEHYPGIAKNNQDSDGRNTKTVLWSKITDELNLAYDTTFTVEQFKKKVQNVQCTSRQKLYSGKRNLGEAEVEYLRLFETDKIPAEILLQRAKSRRSQSVLMESLIGNNETGLHGLATSDHGDYEAGEMEEFKVMVNDDMLDECYSNGGLEGSGGSGGGICSSSGNDAHSVCSQNGFGDTPTFDLDGDGGAQLMANAQQLLMAMVANADLLSSATNTNTNNGGNNSTNGNNGIHHHQSLNGGHNNGHSNKNKSSTNSSNNSSNVKDLAAIVEGILGAAASVQQQQQQNQQQKRNNCANSNSNSFSGGGGETTGEAASSTSTTDGGGGLLPPAVKRRRKASTEFHNSSSNNNNAGSTSGKSNAKIQQQQNQESNKTNQKSSSQAQNIAPIDEELYALIKKSPELSGAAEETVIISDGSSSGTPENHSPNDSGTAPKEGSISSQESWQQQMLKMQQEMLDNQKKMLELFQQGQIPTLENSTHSPPNGKSETAQLTGMVQTLCGKLDTLNGTLATIADALREGFSGGGCESNGVPAKNGNNK